jgi:hypothetical protein
MRPTSTSTPAAKDGWRERMAIMSQAADDNTIGDGTNGAILSAAFDAAPHAQIAIDNAGTLTMFNERARSNFNLVASDLGRPIQDLEMSDRPVELRSLIEQAARGRRPVTVKDIEWQALGREPRVFDVSLVPLHLWGLRSDEVRSQNFLDLDIGLPTEQLRAGIRACLNGDGDHTEQVVPAIGGDGRLPAASPRPR